MAVLLPVLVLAAAILSVVWKFIQQRRLFQGLTSTHETLSLTQQPQPGPPHHPLLGHLPILRDAAQSIPPPDANPHVFAHLIRTKYGLGDFFFLQLRTPIANE
ncbi:hypothetical protein PG994_008901 [Apiospora phragmitis]|uniref:Cytochrome P450 n=1 Tax=Apiospora phragmitis TaxID=2905665 RepID=A0ABR1UHR8_9PEZI